MDVEDALEVFVEVLQSQGTEFVEDTAHLAPAISMGMGTMPTGHQFLAPLPTEPAEGRIVVVDIPQDVAHLQRQFAHQGRSLLIVCSIGRSELCRQGDPDGGNDCCQMELPAIDPAMPATLGPEGIGIDGDMGDPPGLPMFLVPDPVTGTQGGTVQGDRCPHKPRAQRIHRARGSYDVGILPGITMIENNTPVL
jgi:hypothetical protein